MWYEIPVAFPSTVLWCGVSIQRQLYLLIAYLCELIDMFIHILINLTNSLKLLKYVSFLHEYYAFNVQVVDVWIHRTFIFI
jgi:hypothetical protein